MTRRSLLIAIVTVAIVAGCTAPPHPPLAADPCKSPFLIDMIELTVYVNVNALSGAEVKAQVGNKVLLRVNRPVWPESPGYWITEADLAAYVQWRKCSAPRILPRILP